MKGASKQPNKYGKTKQAQKEQAKKKVYKEGETPYDKRRAEYKRQLIRDNKNSGYVDMEKEELEKKINKKFPPAKKVE